MRTDMKVAYVLLALMCVMVGGFVIAVVCSTDDSIALVIPANDPARKQ